MKIELANVRQALELGTKNEWKGQYPEVRARVRLAVNSLLAQDRDIFNKESEYVLAVLRQDKNSGIRKIMKEISVKSFGFAIYTALN